GYCRSVAAGLEAGFRRPLPLLRNYSALPLVGAGTDHWLGDGLELAVVVVSETCSQPLRLASHRRAGCGNFSARRNRARSARGSLRVRMGVPGISLAKRRPRHRSAIFGKLTSGNPVRAAAVGRAAGATG